MCLTRGELTMDGRERFFLVPLDIGEEDDVDILVGVATNHRAHAGVDTFLLREHDVPDAINSEPQPMSVHLVPVIYRQHGRGLGALAQRRKTAWSPVLMGRAAADPGIH